MLERHRSDQTGAVGERDGRRGLGSRVSGERLVGAAHRWEILYRRVDHGLRLVDGLVHGVFHEANGLGLAHEARAVGERAEPYTSALEKSEPDPLEGKPRSELRREGRGRRAEALGLETARKELESDLRTLRRGLRAGSEQERERPASPMQKPKDRLLLCLRLVWDFEGNGAPELTLDQQRDRDDVETSRCFARLLAGCLHHTAPLRHGELRRVGDPRALWRVTWPARHCGERTAVGLPEEHHTAFCTRCETALQRQPRLHEMVHHHRISAGRRSRLKRCACEGNPIDHGGWETGRSGR